MLQKWARKWQWKRKQIAHEVALNLWMHMKIIQNCISSHSSQEQIATKGSTREVYEKVVKNNSKQLNSTTIKW